MTPEQKARVSIDALLRQAGWHVCGLADASIHAWDAAVNLQCAQALRQAAFAKAISPVPSNQEKT